MTTSLNPMRSVWLRVSASIAPFGQALGGIFFIPHPLIGLVFWLALLRNPPYVAFALLGLGIGAAVKRMLRITDAPILGGGLKANALLAAVVSGWLTSGLGLLWWPRLAIAAAAALTAALLAAALMRLLARSIFPPLLWAYCLVAAMLFTVCPACTVTAAQGLPAWLAPHDAFTWVESFLRSMGSLMYSPDALAGLAVCVGVLLWSRTMFLAGLVGWLAGVGVALVFQQMQLVYYWLPVSYNYFITGAALGAVVFLPGRLSLLVAAAGGCAAALFAMVFQYALQWSAASYLPLSSSVAIWVGIGAFTRDRSLVMRNIMSDMPPEERWWHVAYWYQRFGPSFPLLAVPVAGELSVSQGFHGEISHTGAYGHALDFQRPQGQASIWGAAVVSPVVGAVERVRNTVVDNRLGECNYAEVWGNYVVIRLDAGGWALLAHLQQGSIVVVPGTRVEAGTYLGLVGNSGRSPVPHLHMQLQSAPEPGAATLPFRLANYLTPLAQEPTVLDWHASAVPVAGTTLTTAPVNPAVFQTLAGMVPGSAVWMVKTQGQVPRAFRPHKSLETLRVDVQLDALGQRIFQAGRQGRLVTRLDADAWRIVQASDLRSPILRLLALGVPTIAFAARAGYRWHDLAPTLPMGYWLRPFFLPFAPYLRHPFRAVVCTCQAEPAGSEWVFRIESSVQRPSGSLPQRLTCDFAALRGPVRIEATFAKGSLVYTLLSYEPWSPGGGAPP